jgi:hypothetical protein
MSQQLQFTWNRGAAEAPTVAVEETEASSGSALRQAIRRAALRWLEQTAPPTGVATYVVTRI